MSQGSAPFSFIESYRNLLPNADRPIIAMREAAHAELRKAIASSDRVYKLCELAFSLPQSLVDSAWFAEIVAAADAQFVMQQDNVEAGRLAAIVLRDLIATSDGGVSTATTVLATTFAGVRRCVDVELPRFAADALANLAVAGPTPPKLDVTFPEQSDWSEDYAAIKSELAGEHLSQTIEGIMDEFYSNGTDFASSVAAALAAANRRQDRLAEEIDLLWWHIGGWGKAVEKPLSEINANARPLIVGADTGAFIRQPPGPYGVAAILRRSIGESASSLLSLHSAIDALEPTELDSLVHGVSPVVGGIFPVHTALSFAKANGKNEWHTSYKRQTGLEPEVEIRSVDLALQTFRERILLGRVIAQ